MSAGDSFDLSLREFFSDDPLTAFYIKAGTEVFDPATGENTLTETEIPVKAILLDLTLSSNGLSTKYGTDIQAGDKELYILPPEKSDVNALPLNVNTSTDRVRVGSVTYNIFTFKEVNPSGASPILYSLYIRR